MSSLYFFLSLAVVLAYAAELFCNNGSGGFSAPLKNVTCTNAKQCYRLDVDLANRTLLKYDCDENSTYCRNYQENSNNNIISDPAGSVYLYCCNSNNCNYQRNDTTKKVASLYSIFPTIFGLIFSHFI